MFLPLLLPVAGVLLLGFALHRWLAVRAAFCPLAASGCLMLFMLLGGGLNLLAAARIVAYVAVFGLGIYSVWRAPRALLRYLAAPGVVAFMVGAVALCLFYSCNGSFYAGWDEFSHWGQSYKIVHLYDAIYQHTNLGNLYHETYPQGTAVLYYFYALLSPRFIEADTFSVLGTLLCASAATLLVGASWRRPVVAVLGILGVPLFFVLFIYSDPYVSVYQDTLLGAVFGAALVMVVTAQKLERGRTVAVAVVLAMLVQIKPIGLFLAIGVAVLYGMTLSAMRKRTTEPGGARQRWRWLGHLAGCAGALLVSHFGWQLVLAATGFTQDRFAGGGGPGFFARLWAALQGNDPFTASVAERFYINLRVQPVVYNGYGTTVVMFGLLTAAGIVAGIWLWRRQRRGPASVLFGMPVFALVYLGGLLYTYVEKLAEREALLNMSFERYVASLMIGWVMLVLGAVLYYAGTLARAKLFAGRLGWVPRWLPAAAWAAVLALIINTAAQRDVLNVTMNWENSGRRALGQVSAQMLAEMAPGDDVWLIAQGDDGMYRFIFSYTLMPARVAAGLPWTVAADGQDLAAQARAAGVEYMLVYIVDEGFVAQYGTEFSDRLAWVLAENMPALYRVQAAGQAPGFALKVETKA